MPRLSRDRQESVVFGFGPIDEPRLHAKILGWDDDFPVVTSQNWLSADPSEANLRREIGIFIHASGIARLAIEKLVH
jgi:cardiolipin synthase A/B